MPTRTPNRTRQNTDAQTVENSSGRGEDTTEPAALIRRRDTRTGVVIRVAPSHPFATDNGWETITDEKSA